MLEKTSSSLHRRIEGIIGPALNDQGYEIVRINLIGAGTLTLQIMAERTDQNHLSIRDCEMISQTASALLDVEDPIQKRYILEVTSPGLDRPLIKLQDFERFKGRQAKVELKSGLDGRKNFNGILQGVDENTVKILVDKNEFGLPFDDIKNAKLVLTDEQFRESLRKGKN